MARPRLPRKTSSGKRFCELSGFLLGRELRVLERAEAILKRVKVIKTHQEFQVLPRGTRERRCPSLVRGMEAAGVCVTSENIHLHAVVGRSCQVCPIPPFRKLKISEK